MLKLWILCKAIASVQCPRSKNMWNFWWFVCFSSALLVGLTVFPAGAPTWLLYCNSRESCVLLHGPKVSPFVSRLERHSGANRLPGAWLHHRMTGRWAQGRQTAVRKRSSPINLPAFTALYVHVPGWRQSLLPARVAFEWWNAEKNVQMGAQFLLATGINSCGHYEH